MYFRVHNCTFLQIQTEPLNKVHQNCSAVHYHLSDKIILVSFFSGLLSAVTMETTRRRAQQTSNGKASEHAQQSAQWGRAWSALMATFQKNVHFCDLISSNHINGVYLNASFMDTED